MPATLDYLHKVLGIDLSILDFISQKLAVSLSELSKQFKLPSAQVKDKVVPLVAANYVNERNGSMDPVYTITAAGVKEVERSTKRGLAAFF